MVKAKRRKRELSTMDKIETALKKEGKLTIRQIDQIFQSASAYWAMEDDVLVNPFNDEEW